MGLPKEPPKIYSTVSAGDVATVQKYLAKKDLDPNTTVVLVVLQRTH